MQPRTIAKRAVIIPDGLGKTDHSTRVVSLPRAPWESQRSLLAARPETAPRQRIILATEARRRGIKGHALGNLMRSMIADELRHLSEENHPAEVFI